MGVDRREMNEIAANGTMIRNSTKERKREVTEEDRMRRASCPCKTWEETQNTEQCERAIAKARMNEEAKTTMTHAKMKAVIKRVRNFQAGRTV